MITLVAKDVVYFSALDEETFFAWLNKLKCISELRGIGTALNITVQPPTDADLRELIAVFSRYKIDQRQLAQFLTLQNKSWFKDPVAYWHATVFQAA